MRASISGSFGYYTTNRLARKAQTRQNAGNRRFVLPVNARKTDFPRGRRKSAGKVLPSGPNLGRSSEMRKSPVCGRLEGLSGNICGEKERRKAIQPSAPLLREAFPVCFRGKTEPKRGFSSAFRGVSRRLRPACERGPFGAEPAAGDTARPADCTRISREIPCFLAPVRFFDDSHTAFLAIFTIKGT